MTMLDLSDVARVHFRLIEEGEEHPAPKFDYTTLNSVSECPTWGIVRYVLHKTTSEPDRAMALEAGEALHDVFAAIRLTFSLSCFLFWILLVLLAVSSSEFILFGTY